jgi:hypothetical protein
MGTPYCGQIKDQRYARSSFEHLRDAMNFFDVINEDLDMAFASQSRNTTVVMPGMSERHPSTPDLTINRTELRCPTDATSVIQIFSS